MEDVKVLDLIEKMYKEFSLRFDSMDQRFDGIDQRFDRVETRLDRLEEITLKTSMQIENEINPKIQVLFDGYIQNPQAIERIEEKLDSLQEDVRHLSIKSIAQERSIFEIKKKVK